jgi:hypothetical protein
LLVIAVALLYSWAAAYWRPFTWPMYIATALPIVAVLVVDRRHDRPAENDRPPRRSGLAVWAGLFALALVWELAAYFASPRQDHPTLSTIADNIMSTHLGRTAAFALWLALGSVLFFRSRSSAS